MDVTFSKIIRLSLKAKKKKQTTNLFTKRTEQLTA